MPTRDVAAIACCLVSACAASVPAPMVQVPLLRRAGEAEAGFVAGTASQQSEIGGTLRIAPTDWLRVGAAASAATGSEQRAFAHGASRDTPKLFADGFVGAEWGGWILRYGVLVGSGFGSRNLRSRGCPTRGQDSCSLAHSREVEYVRSYGQLHLAVAPPGPLVASLALRVPAVVELPGEGVEARGSSAHEQNNDRRTRVGLEVALTQSVMLRYLRLDLQPLWSKLEGFAFHLAFLVRIRRER